MCLRLCVFSPSVLKCVMIYYRWILIGTKIPNISVFNIEFGGPVVVFILPSDLFLFEL